MELKGDEICMGCGKPISEFQAFITAKDERDDRNVYICPFCAVEIGILADEGTVSEEDAETAIPLDLPKKKKKRIVN